MVDTNKACNDMAETNRTEIFKHNDNGMVLRNVLELSNNRDKPCVLH